MSTIPNEINEATKAAMAKAVPALSVSTTLRTATAPEAVGFVAAGLPETPGGIPGTPPAFTPGEAPGSGGFTAGIATVAPAPGGLGPAPAGRGGREMRMVSLRKSAGGLFPTAGSGADGAEAPPGTEGTPGTPGAAEGGSLGATGIAGLGGLSRMVSFFTPGTGGGTARPGGLVAGIPGGNGGFGTAGKGGAKGGFGAPGGKGKPSAI